MVFPNDYKVIIRGGGDIATGVIWTLYNAGFKVLVLEIDKPSTIRRTVSFSQAIYSGETTVDGVKAVVITDINELNDELYKNYVPIIIDPNCNSLDIIKPDILIDSILAKKNLGTTINMAKLVIGIGPGFTCNEDCNVAIETMRGHKLGKIYHSGSPISNTGLPGEIAHHTDDRVLYSNNDGIIKHNKKISDIVHTNDIIAYIDDIPVKATIDGVLRGLIVEGYNVKKGLKIADIDPRLNEQENSFSISDKARTIGGAVLLAIMNAKKNNQI